MIKLEYVLFASVKKTVEIFFDTTNEVTFCTVAENLMQELNILYKQDDWRVFIDDSKTRLNGVLLHNNKVLPSTSVAYVAVAKESYITMRGILNSINSLYVLI